jgi:hypothetical protein
MAWLRRVIGGTIAPQVIEDGEAEEPRGAMQSRRWPAAPGEC